MTEELFEGGWNCVGGNHVKLDEFKVLFALHCDSWGLTKIFCNDLGVLWVFMIQFNFDVHEWSHQANDWINWYNQYWIRNIKNDFIIKQLWLTEKLTIKHFFRNIFNLSLNWKLKLRVKKKYLNSWVIIEILVKKSWWHTAANNKKQLKES